MANCPRCAELEERLAAAERERNEAIAQLAIPPFEHVAAAVKRMELAESRALAAEAALEQEQERNRNNVANADMEIRDLRAALERAREAGLGLLRILDAYAQDESQGKHDPECEVCAAANALRAALSPSQPSQPQGEWCGACGKAHAPDGPCCIKNQPSAPEMAGQCEKCGGIVYHRPGKPGEYDHKCKPAPGEKGESHGD